MARIVTGGFTTFNLATHLDPMTLDLYGVADHLSTPGYAGATPKLYVHTSGNIGIGQVPTVQLELSMPGVGIPLRVAPLTAYPVSQAATYIGSASSFITGANGDLLLIPRTNTTANVVVATGNGTPAERLRVDAVGVVTPGADNTQTLGAAAKRWSTVYAGTGTINTSDAREKTQVEPLSAAETAAAVALAREIGVFQFLSAAAQKGDGARLHIGLTVQRAMAIMSAQGLDPLRYAFICHDTWPAVEIPAATEERRTGVLNAQGDPVTETVTVRAAYTLLGGDRYGFRADELLLFIARGFEARLTALEAAAS